MDLLISSISLDEADQMASTYCGLGLRVDLADLLLNAGIGGGPVEGANPLLGPEAGNGSTGVEVA